MSDLEIALQNENYNDILVNQLDSVTKDIMISNQDKVLKFLDFKLQKLGNDTSTDQETDYSIVLSIISKAFKFYLNNFKSYQVWLDKLLLLIDSEELFKVEKSRSASHENSEYLNSPRLLSLIAVFSMLNYLQRNDDVDGVLQEKESKIVNISAKQDPTIIIFPLSCITSHIIGIFTGGNSPVDLANLLEFLEVYFSISYLKEYPTKYSVTQSQVNQWRELLLTFKLENKMPIQQHGNFSNHQEQLEFLVSNFCTDVLFVDAIFKQDSSIELRDMKFEWKMIEHEPEQHIAYLEMIKEKVIQGTPNMNMLGTVFIKCIVFLESLTCSSKPKCCKFNLLTSLLDAGSEYEKKETILDFIFYGFLELKVSLNERPDRLRDIMSLWQAYLGFLITSQEKMYRAINSLSSETATLLVKESELLTSLISTFIKHKDALGSQEFTEMRKSWHALCVRFHQPEMVAQVYTSMVKFAFESLLIRRILQNYEVGISSSDYSTAEKYKESFVKFLGILNSSAPAANCDPVDLNFAYFDLLNQAEKFKGLLFKVNIAICFYISQSQTEPMEMEDGEEGEEGMIDEFMNDTQAAFKLFPPPKLKLRIADPASLEHVPKKVKTETPPVINNPLVCFEVLNFARKVENAKSITRKMLEFWNVLASTIPAQVFSQCMIEVIKTYYPREEALVLDEILVQFIMQHQWAVEECSRYLVEFTTKLSGNSLAPESSPFATIAKHIGSQTANTKVALLFLKTISNMCIKRMEKVDFPRTGILKQLASKRKQVLTLKDKEELYRFLKWDVFPKDLVSLISQICMSAGNSIIDPFFSQQLQEMNKKSENMGNNEIFLASILNQCDTSHTVLESFTKLFLLENDKLKFNFIHFPLLHLPVHIYFTHLFSNDANRTESLRIILSSDVYQKEKDLQAFIEMIAIPSSFYDTWVKLWPQIIVIIESNNYLNTVAFETLFWFLTNHFNILQPYQRKLAFNEFFRQFNSSKENPRIQYTIKKWANLISTLSPLYFPLLDLYSDDLDKSLVAVIVNHVKSCLGHKNSGFYLFTHCIFTDSIPATNLIRYMIASEPEESRNLIIQRLSVGVNRTLTSLLYHYTTQTDLENTEWDQAEANTFKVFLALIPVSKEFMELLMEPTYFNTILSLLTNSKLKSSKMILEFLAEYYKIIASLPQIEIDEITSNQDTLWQIKFSDITQNIIAKDILTPFLDMLPLLLSVFGKASKLSYSVTCFCINKLYEMDKDTCYRLLEQLSIHTDEELVLPYLRTWIYTESHSENLLKLISKHCKAKIFADSAFIALLCKNQDDESKSAIILNILQDNSNLDLTDAIPFLTTCLIYPKLYQRALDLLRKIRTRVSKMKTSKWFDCLVRGIIMKSADTKIGSRAILYMALDEMSNKS
ncbi:hypothetical protein HDV01_000579 [Terramyces sp. JEL0728]|nr:hypothetical protein HDV01_000579 [Terramyces sp. JEL0728]